MLLYDAHCHLDFSDNSAELAAGLSDQGVRVVSATVTPSGFLRANEILASCAHVHVGLGFHPWWVSDGSLVRADLDEFARLAASESVRYISEVGLDFGPKRLAASVGKGLAASGDAARALQMDVFERVLAAADAVSGRFISLHSVKAEKETLDALMRCGMPSRHACVFHGYAGPQDQLMRLCDQGCYVSVGPRMLSSKRGREYVKAIPAERILLETDAPSAPGGPASSDSLAAMLKNTVESIADLRRLEGERREGLFALIEETSRRVLRF